MDVLMVGMALDTNGQKHRYVEAARRWGADPDVVRALIVGNWDGAGIPSRLAAASADSEVLSIRSAHRATAYFDFPLDIHWTRATHAEVQRLADEAHVIHLTNDFKAYFQLRLGKVRKPAIVHHHGTLFRNNPGRMLAEARRFGFVQAVSTIDLKRPAPDELHWLPAPLDLDAMAEIRSINRRTDDGTVRIMSSPTRRDLKSTDRLAAAVEALKAEGLPVELVLVEGRSWAECLAVKGSADIYFDQVAVPETEYPGGYGCNAIEAWGMGIPVVAGADDWTLAAMRKEFGSEHLPFYVATEDTIADALRALVTSKRLRTEYGKRGRAHAERFHAEKPALKRLAELYSMAIASRPQLLQQYEEFLVGPGVFRTELQRLRVNILNQTYVFAQGEIRIENPQIAQRMRRIARYQPEHRITEVFA